MIPSHPGLNDISFRGSSALNQQELFGRHCLHPFLLIFGNVFSKVLVFANVFIVLMAYSIKLPLLIPDILAYVLLVLPK